MKTVNSGEILPTHRDELTLTLLLPQISQPLWKSLPRCLNEFLFPRSLPPLKLESRPIFVKEIWAFNDAKKKGVWTSVALHILLLAFVIGVPLLPIHHPVPVIPKEIATPLIYTGADPLKPAQSEARGGGGGGARELLPASAGRLPRLALRQITPPTVLPNPMPKLTVESTVIVPPDIQISARANLPNLGDPKSYAVIPSSGSGANGGIGPGSNGGVGPGQGNGVGPGVNGGSGRDTFRMGKGITAPRLIYQTDPEFSEEARKAKYQGNCVLGLVVDASGHPTNIRVLNSLGMGLDQKAIESVKNWRFEPGKRDGRGVAVEIAVEVDFHLY